jgi:hypothetical protein
VPASSEEDLKVSHDRDPLSHAEPMSDANTNEAKTVAIQVQPALSPDLDCTAAIQKLTSLSKDSWFDDGNDDGPYVNIFLRTDDVSKLWVKIRTLLVMDANLAKCAIVTCEGEQGWDDYLLLHHFDGSEPLDQILN